MSDAHTQAQPVVSRAEQRDQIFQLAIEFIGTLTGMNAPAIETAPPEIFAPFYSFVDRVQAITTPQPARTPPDDFTLRGVLASSLKCWHRLDTIEAAELVALFQNLNAAQPVIAASAVTEPDARLEVVAKAIYDQWSSMVGFRLWQDGGNCLKQDEARDIARSALAAAQPVVDKGGAA